VADRPIPSLFLTPFFLDLVGGKYPQSFPSIPFPGQLEERLTEPSIVCPDPFSFSVSFCWGSAKKPSSKDQGPLSFLDNLQSPPFLDQVHGVVQAFPFFFPPLVPSRDSRVVVSPFRHRSLLYYGTPPQDFFFGPSFSFPSLPLKIADISRARSAIFSIFVSRSPPWVPRFFSYCGPPPAACVFFFSRDPVFLGVICPWRIHCLQSRPLLLLVVPVLWRPSPFPLFYTCF